MSLEIQTIPMDDGYPAGIRTATLADLPALVEMETAAFHSDRFNRRQFRYLLTRAQATSFVAVEADAPVAGYAIVLYRRGSQSARLYSLAVSIACRGRGLGKRLLAGAAHSAAAHGATSLHLEVRADNTVAIRLYAEQGYCETGRLSDYYEDGETAIRMRRPITPMLSR